MIKLDTLAEINDQIEINEGRLRDFNSGLIQTIEQRVRLNMLKENQLAKLKEIDDKKTIATIDFMRNPEGI